jgi:hypothetical protein
VIVLHEIQMETQFLERSGIPALDEKTPIITMDDRFQYHAIIEVRLDLFHRGRFISNLAGLKDTGRRRSS